MKLYIKSFSLHRGEAITKLSNLSTPLNEHIIKCIIFGKYRQEAYSHWMHEIVTFIASCDKGNITGAKLKEKDYRESLFGSFGTSKQDARDNLEQFKVINIRKHKEYNEETSLPYYNVNNVMVENLYDCYRELEDACIPLLRDKKVHATTFWKKIISPIIDSYTYSLEDGDITSELTID